jgi:hypothetical protein
MWGGLPTAPLGRPKVSRFYIPTRSEWETFGRGRVRVGRPAHIGRTRLRARARLKPRANESQVDLRRLRSPRRRTSHELAWSFNSTNSDRYGFRARIAWLSMSGPSGFPKRSMKSRIG